MDNKKPAILVELRVSVYCRMSPDLEMVAMQGNETLVTALPLK